MPGRSADSGITTYTVSTIVSRTTALFSEFFASPEVVATDVVEIGATEVVEIGANVADGEAGATEAGAFVDLFTDFGAVFFSTTAVFSFFACERERAEPELLASA